MSLSKRIISMIDDDVPVKEIPKTVADSQIRQESPLPQEFREELIQLQDPLEDVFDEDKSGEPHTTPIDSTIPLRNDSSDGKRYAQSDDESEEGHPTPMPSPNAIENCDNQLCEFCGDTSGVPEDDYENIDTPAEIHSVSDVPTPSSTTSLRKKTYKSDKGKNRRVHKNRWVTVQRKKKKQKKNTGQEFVNKKGKVVEEKQKDPCTEKCRLKCREKLSYEDRLRILKYFWHLGDKQRHWEFVIKSTKKGLKRRQTTEVTKHNRQNTFQYFLPDAQKQAVKVCKTMFLSTISLSERVVTTAWKKYDGNTMTEEDKRGHYAHGKRVYNDEMVKSVCDHVRCFPVVESHLIRKDSNTLYLEGIESESRMFKLYCQLFDSSKYSSKATTKRQCREIFNKNFNLALHKPKKDKCDVCHIFENKSQPTVEEKDVFSKHLARKVRAREMKKADKNEAEGNNKVVAATFDFQMKGFAVNNTKKNSHVT